MGCVICEKIAEKKAVFVFDDSDVAAIMTTKPAASGHVRVLTKSHFSKIEDMGDELFEKLMQIASVSSAAVFDAVRAQGTNIILSESNEHLVVDVIPRKENDGLNFSWKAKEASPGDLDDAFSRIKDKAFTVGKRPEKKQSEPSPLPVMRDAPDVPPAASNSSGEPHEPEEKPVNYMLKNLERIP